MRTPPGKSDSDGSYDVTYATLREPYPASKNTHLNWTQENKSKCFQRFH